MTYLGQVHKGVVVLKDAPPLGDGTIVRVETAINPHRVGSPAAVLEGLQQTGDSWAASSDEMSDALEYLRRTKWDDAHRQQQSPESAG